MPDGSGEANYTENYDLFIFEYDNDAQNIHLNGFYLDQFIDNLKKEKIISGRTVKVVAHSMGGLVARNAIENLNPRTYRAYKPLALLSQSEYRI